MNIASLNIFSKTKAYPVIKPKKEDKKQIPSLYDKEIFVSKPAGLFIKDDERSFNAFLLRPSRVTKKEYEDVLRNHPSYLIKAQKYVENKYVGLTKPIQMAKIALKANNYLLNKFDNFRIISLGTSPASLTEQLAAIGHDVIFLPVSGLRRYDPDKQKLSDLPDLQTAIEYLRKKNIDDGKLNIVLDYTSSGRTLEYMTKFIKEYYLLDDSQITQLSLSNLLFGALYEREISEENEKIKLNYFKDLELSFAELASNVPHFPVLQKVRCLYDAEDNCINSKDKTKEEIYSQFDNYSTPIARAYSLCTMNEINKLQNSSISFCGNLKDFKAKLQKAGDTIAYSEFIHKEGKVTRTQYENVLKRHPAVINNARTYCKNCYSGFTSPYEMAQIVKKVDKYLKEKFPDSRIISLGTSPAALTEQLAAMGHDVIFLPVSGLRDFNPKVHGSDNMPRLKIVLDYLQDKHIDDGKLNIILDYTSSGKTLRNMAHFIRQYYSLDNDKVMPMSLYALLSDVYEEAEFEERIRKSTYLDDIKFSYADEISNVPHFPVIPECYQDYDSKINSINPENLSNEEIYQKFDSYSTPLARAYSLCVMNEINKQK